MPQIFTSPKTLGEVLKHEYSRETCREVVILAASETDYEIGTVLGKKSDGKWARCTVDSDPSTASGVLLEPKKASEADIPDAVVIVRGPAIVADTGLEWDASINTPELKKQKHEQLAALGIAVREAV